MPMIACESCDAFNPSTAAVCVECGARLQPDAARPQQPGAAPPPLPSGPRRSGGGAPAARAPSPRRRHEVKSRADRVAEEGAAGRAQLRSRAARDRGNAAALRLILVGVLAAGLVAVAGWFLTRPEPVDGAVESFAQKWAAGDGAGIVAMVDGGSARAASRFEDDLARRGWSASPPALGELVIERDDVRPAAVWACAGGELMVRWRRGPNGGWQIYSYRMPDWEPPTVSPAVEAFRVAWASGGVSGLQALTRDPGGRVAQGIARLLDGRGWSQSRPQLSEVYVDAERGRSKVRFRLAGNILKVTFEYWHPRWRVTGMKLPER